MRLISIWKSQNWLVSLGVFKGWKARQWKIWTIKRNQEANRFCHFDVLARCILFEVGRFLMELQEKRQNES